MDVKRPGTSGATDAEIFMAAVAGLCLVFVLGGITFQGLKAGADASGHVTLIALVAPIETVRPLYFAFLMVPALVAFLAVGVPVLVRVLLRLKQGSARESALLLALLLCGLLVYLDGASGNPSLVALLLALAIGMRGGARPIRRLANKLAGGLCLASAAVFFLLAWQGAGVQAGQSPGVALLPTLVVSCCFLLPLSMVALAMADRRPVATAVAVVIWLSAVAWYVLSVTGAAPVPSAVELQAVATWTTATVLLLGGLLISYLFRSGTR